MSTALTVPNPGQHEPPTPPGNPVFGNLLDFGRDVNGFLLRCAREYGPIVKLRMVHRTAYFVSDPKFNEYVLLGNYRNFIKHKLFFGRMRAAFGRGILSSDGDFWRRHRRMAAPAFHRDRIAEYGDIMTNYAQEMLASEWRDGQTRNVYLDMRSVAAKIVARALFDETIAGDVQRVEDAMNLLLEAIAERMLNPLVAPDWMPTPGVRRYRKAVSQLDALVNRFIADHKANLEGRKTLLAMLMQARYEDGTPMSDKQLRDESITLFFAGHETTATALTWAIYLLTQNPEWQKHLHAVVDGLNGVPPRAKDLGSIAAVEWTIKETLRVFPSVSVIARQVVADCEIGGYPIKAGSLLYMSPWVMHRDAKYFDNPEQFMPERWNSDLESRLPRHTYMPFSGGPRVCIGDRFAMMEATLLLANFLQKYEFEYAGDAPPKPFASLTLIPVGGMPVRIKQRAGVSS